MRRGRGSGAWAAALAAVALLAGGCSCQPSRGPDRTAPHPTVGASVVSSSLPAGATRDGSTPPPAKAGAATADGGGPLAASAASARASSAVAPSAAERVDGGVEPAGPTLRALTEWRADRRLGGSDRMARAKRARGEIVQALFAEAGVAFPPPVLLFRVFKKEQRFEVWAPPKASEPLVHVTSYEICFGSGTLGPKRRQGDGQVPEGFYTVGYFSPTTPYHLAMQISYPSDSDRILGDKRDPGNEIMIHGDCVSAGCIAMGDERSEELWVMATTVGWSGGKVHVHIYPTRNIDGLIASGQMPEHHAFWRNLAEVARAFDADHRLPLIGVAPDGRYIVR